MICRHIMQTPAPSRFDSDAVLTTIGGYALAISRALEHNGIDSARIFHAAGIDPSLMKNDPMMLAAGRHDGQAL